MNEEILDLFKQFGDEPSFKLNSIDKSNYQLIIRNNQNVR
jgi:hypothetical protein